MQTIFHYIYLHIAVCYHWMRIVYSRRRAQLPRFLCVVLDYIFRVDAVEHPSVPKESVRVLKALVYEVDPDDEATFERAVPLLESDPNNVKSIVIDPVMDVTSWMRFQWHDYVGDDDIIKFTSCPWVKTPHVLMVRYQGHRWSPGAPLRTYVAMYYCNGEKNHMFPPHGARACCFEGMGHAKVIEATVDGIDVTEDVIQLAGCWGDFPALTRPLLSVALRTNQNVRVEKTDWTSFVF